MIVGHTKFASDACGGNYKKQMRKANQINTIWQIKDIVDNKMDHNAFNIETVMMGNYLCNS